ncbi:Alpha/beta hydrolase fold-1 [Apodospora peruviana]|uniref:Alpha/beta hydrolase fold-1 n=1 Tax=Apodospora peruviana TaxID=516989 RepID=A0AAE0HW63_9PEZI|nr:Alpha/beta hydrolase fold-1 [Apodospora peruviana]
MEHRSVCLTSKPGASLAISTLWSENKPLANTIVVFLNGLVLPRSSWLDTVNHLISQPSFKDRPLPALLLYDRYGQGDSDPDPTDPPGTPYGHDAREVVADLHQLLDQVCRHDLNKSSLADMIIVLVCNSIGCPIARLFAAEHPGLVAGLLFLDSMMANSDFVSLFPDPAGAGFDAGQLPSDVSVEHVRHAREMFTKFFHPTVPNPEHFDRRTLAELLPDADKPALPPARDRRSPLLVVVGHDPSEFAKQCEEGTLSVPKAAINAFVNPAWHRYNQGLTRLVAHGTGQVKIAKGCGHFIQRDDPQFVAGEISDLLNRLDQE